MNEINSSNSIFDYLPEDTTLSFEQKQSRLLSLPIFQPTYIDFHNCCLKGRKVEHLKNSPLTCFLEKITEWGAHFHGIGKGLVKGANLAFRTKQELNELDFKVNHVFRKKLESTIEQLEGLDKYVRRAVIERASNFGKDILVERNQPFPLGDSTMGTSTKITIEGLGTIFIGSNPDLPTMYNRVVVQMDKERTINDFHELLALFKLETSFENSSAEDQMRHKIGHLFRAFYPREALSIERSEAFFTLSIEELKEKILELVPEMEEIFEEYLDQMTLQEILPGRMRYRINGLAQKAYDLGARGLTAAITGAYSDDALFERLVSILQKGMMSSETRRSNGVTTIGMSTSADFYSGGADSVFTQMITSDNCQKEASFNHLYYHSDIRLIFSLDVLESGTYQYLDDSFGNRIIEFPTYYSSHYTERPGIYEFIENLQKGYLTSARRETEASPADLERQWREFQVFILGLLEQKTQDLERERMIEYDREGRMKIMGMFLPEFMSVLKTMFFMLNGGSSDVILYPGHEVMVKERIAPSFIQKILLRDHEMKEKLTQYLEATDLIVLNADGEKTLLGHNVDQFLVVEEKATDSLFAIL